MRAGLDVFGGLVKRRGRREDLIRLSGRSARLVLLVLAISLLAACGQSDGGPDGSPETEDELRPEIPASVEATEERPADEEPAEPDEPPASEDELPPDVPASAEAIEEGPADGGADEPPAPEQELSPEIVALVEAIEAGMPEPLIDSAVTLWVGCATMVAAGSPPECLNGDPEGTEYEVFPGAGCQPGWTPANVLAETLRTVVQNTGPLYAVVAVGAPAPHPHGRGDTLLVFEAVPPVQRGAGVLFGLEAGQLVRFAIGCNTPEQLTMGHDSSLEHTVIFRPDPDGQ